MDPGTTYPCSWSGFPSQACGFAMTSSTCLKYSVPSWSVDHNRPAKASTRTAAVTPNLIYRCVIRTSGLRVRGQDSLTRTWMQGTARPSIFNILKRLAIAMADLGQQLRHARHRKADHVRVRTFDPGDETRSESLNCVPA